MDDELKRKIAASLDPASDAAADGAVVAALESDPQARAYQQGLRAIDGALRQWPAPTRSAADWEKFAMSLERRLGEAPQERSERGAAWDPLERPAFEDEDEADTGPRKRSERVSMSQSDENNSSSNDDDDDLAGLAALARTSSKPSAVSMSVPPPVRPGPSLSDDAMDDSSGIVDIKQLAEIALKQSLPPPASTLKPTSADVSGRSDAAVAAGEAVTPRKSSPDVAATPAATAKSEQKVPAPTSAKAAPAPAEKKSGSTLWIYPTLALAAVGGYFWLKSNDHSDRVAQRQEEAAPEQPAGASAPVAVAAPPTTTPAEPVAAAPPPVAVPEAQPAAPAAPAPNVAEAPTPTGAVAVPAAAPVAESAPPVVAAAQPAPATATTETAAPAPQAAPAAHTTETRHTQSGGGSQTVAMNTPQDHGSSGGGHASSAHASAPAPAATRTAETTDSEPAAPPPAHAAAAAPASTGNTAASTGGTTHPSSDTGSAPASSGGGGGHARSMDELMNQATGGHGAATVGGSGGGGGGGSASGSNAAPAPAALPDRLNSAQVHATLSPLSAAVRACTQGQYGTATVAMMLVHDGTVQTAHVSGPFDANANSCITGVVSRAHFPQFARPSMPVVFPFSVQPPHPGGH